MLTSEASNALLKTLEEPPEHAILILATTEAHKILPPYFALPAVRLPSDPAAGDCGPVADDMPRPRVWSPARACWTESREWPEAA